MDEILGLGPDHLLNARKNMQKINLKWNDSRVIFSIIVLLIALFICNKMFFPIIWNAPIQMHLIKQNGNVDHLDVPLNIDFQRTFYINTINFPEDQTLIHKDIGNFGIQNNFLIDFNTAFEVKKEGNYLFIVASDDGFRLKLNGNMVGEFTNNRPFTTNQYNLFLEKGTYHYNLYYYQGFGGMGVVAEYQRMDDSKVRFIGENSYDFHFKRE
jgi:hypothetical protein